MKTAIQNNLTFLSAILHVFILIVPIYTTAHDKNEIKYINVVFRHGDRTPSFDFGESYPTDPNRDETFYPEGYGQLTNSGKRKVYIFGSILRYKYGKFLGNVYLQEEVGARCTAIVRSKMSLQLVLAALYPPTIIQRWSREINWQPVDINYLPIEQDRLLFPFSCAGFRTAYDAVLASDEVKAKQEEYRNFLNELTVLTGKPMQSTLDAFLLYQTFDAEYYNGLPLPLWSRRMYPNGLLKNVSVLAYEFANYNTQLRRLNGGILLREMIENMQAVMNGTLPRRKINLYSAHDTTVVAMLKVLGVYDREVPRYTSGVILELRSRRDGYFVKVVRYLGDPPVLQEVNIPGCDTMCPFEQFLSLLQDVIPSNEELECVPVPILMVP